MIKCSPGHDEEEDSTNWKSRSEEEAEEERQEKGQRRKVEPPRLVALATPEKPSGEESLEAEEGQTGY